jgi:predicted nucleic acid-binding protein
MNDYVVDTSVAVKWVLAEPDSNKALQVVTDTVAANKRLFVLDLVLVEAANVFWTRYHRGLLTLPEAQQALTLLLQATVQVLPCLPILQVAFDLAARYNVAVYDALFVAVLQNLGADGVTADEPLVRAVGADFTQIKLLRNW